MITWILVIFEGIVLLLLPLVIGWTVDDLLKSRTSGIIQLGVLCLSLLIIGAGRRFYDTRAYSSIYQKVSNEMIAREKNRATSVSIISARANLFTEFIEFLENSIPDIFNHLIGLVGTLFIIASIDVRIFGACLAGAALTAAVYTLSQKKMFTLNRGQNNELERQVEVLSSHSSERVHTHFRKLMKWNIKQSDLETVNFSITWFILAGVLLFSVVATSSATSSFGQIVSVIMYVFGFIESVLAFPLYYQQMVRLQEIAGRLG